MVQRKIAGQAVAEPAFAPLTPLDITLEQGLGHSLTPL